MIYSVEKTIQGAWRVSGIVNGYLKTRQYFGYTRTESIRLWKEESR